MEVKVRVVLVEPCNDFLENCGAAVFSHINLVARHVQQRADILYGAMMNGVKFKSLESLFIDTLCQFNHRLGFQDIAPFFHEKHIQQFIWAVVIDQILDFVIGQSLMVVPLADDIDDAATDYDAEESSEFGKGAVVLESFGDLLVKANHDCLDEIFALDRCQAFEFTDVGNHWTVACEELVPGDVIAIQMIQQSDFCCRKRHGILAIREQSKFISGFN